MSSYKTYRDVRLAADPELKAEYERYWSSLERVGEPVSLSDVENINIRMDARALMAYAKERGISTLDLSDEERAAFRIDPPEPGETKK